MCRPERPPVPPHSSWALPGQARITRPSASEHSLLLAPMSSMQRGHSSCDSSPPAAACCSAAAAAGSPEAGAALALPSSAPGCAEPAASQAGQRCNSISSMLRPAQPHRRKTRAWPLSTQRGACTMVQPTLRPQCPARLHSSPAPWKRSMDRNASSTAPLSGPLRCAESCCEKRGSVAGQPEGPRLRPGTCRAGTLSGQVVGCCDDSHCTEEKAPGGSPCLAPKHRVAQVRSAI